MKALRQITTATILSLTLAISAFGGHIETPGAPCPTCSTSVTDVPTGIVLTIISVVYP